MACFYVIQRLRDFLKRMRTWWPHSISQSELGFAGRPQPGPQRGKAPDSGLKTIYSDVTGYKKHPICVIVDNNPTSKIVWIALAPETPRRGWIVASRGRKLVRAHLRIAMRARDVWLATLLCAQSHRQLRTVRLACGSSSAPLYCHSLDIQRFSEALMLY